MRGGGGRLAREMERVERRREGGEEIVEGDARKETEEHGKKRILGEK